jgi:hypothetical protein
LVGHRNAFGKEAAFGKEKGSVKKHAHVERLRSPGAPHCAL